MDGGNNFASLLKENLKNFLINFGGLGQLINDLAERYDLPGTYGAICFVVLTSILFFDVTARLERWLRPVE